MATSGTSSVTDFYPRSPCGERLRQPGKIQGSGHFYPRSPCGERPVHFMRSWTTTTFLSTLSLRRATSPNGGQYSVYSISIHALLAESDQDLIAKELALAAISIHALLAESDCRTKHSTNPKNHFYPRSPCGERPIVYDIVFMPREFLSTLSLRRATSCGNSCTQAVPISIHALLAESDPSQFKPPIQAHHFYPRSPCGERRKIAQNNSKIRQISIHALLAESDSVPHRLIPRQ